MEPAARFLEFADAFEKTYADDDWDRLEPYFTEDAIYSVSGGPPLGGRFEGRRQVLEHLREVLDELDRRFDERRVEPVGTPTIGKDSFEMGWRATYQKPGCPDLIFEGIERARFQGDRIALLEDILEDGVDERIQAYLDQYFR